MPLLGRHGVLALAAAPQLTALTSLDLTCIDDGDDDEDGGGWPRALAAAAWLTNLRVLTLTEISEEDRPCPSLALAGRALPHLHSMTIRQHGGGIDSGGPLPGLATASLPSLTKLTWICCRIPPGGFPRADWQSGLESLTLGVTGAGPSDHAVQGFCRAPLRALKSLRLCLNNATDATVMTVAQAAASSGGGSGGGGGGGGGGEAAAGAGAAPGVGAGVAPGGGHWLCTSLAELSLRGGMSMGKEAAAWAALAAAPLAAIRVVDLTGVWSFTPQTARSLGAAEWIGKLEELKLKFDREYGRPDEMLLALRESPRFKLLEAAGKVDLDR
jgi:hypothetical protein